jgi:hypothetical protein
METCSSTSRIIFPRRHGEWGQCWKAIQFELLVLCGPAKLWPQTIYMLSPICSLERKRQIYTEINQLLIHRPSTLLFMQGCHFFPSGKKCHPLARQYISSLNVLSKCLKQNFVNTQQLVLYGCQRLKSLSMGRVSSQKKKV